MLVSDGFGNDGVSAEPTEDEILDSYSLWLYKVATGYSQGNPNHERVDDLVQEGRVAMWRALHTHKSESAPLDWWLKTAATNRMKDLLVRKTPFLGETRERNSDKPEPKKKGSEARSKIMEVLRANPAATGAQIAKEVGLSEGTVSYHRSRMGVDAPPPEMSSFDALLDGGFDITMADNALERVLNGYFRGEVAEALDALTPNEKKYVILRFWHGMQKAELSAQFGYDPSGIWRVAKKKLAPALSNLISV